MTAPWTTTPEQRLRLFAEHATDYAIVIIDPEGRVIEWSAGAEQLTGWMPGEAVGRHFAFIFTPEDRAAGIPGAEIETARRRGRAPDVRWHLRKDGSRFFVDGVLNAITGPDGAIAGFGKVLRDITARKLVEDILARQASLLDLSHEAVFSWHLGGAITYWNRGAAELYGYTAEEAVGRVSHQLLATEFPAGLDAVEGALRRDGQWRGELVHRAKDGRRIRVDSRFALRTDLGERPLVLETSRDITERRRVEEALRESEALFRDTFNAAGGALAHVGLGGRWLRFNDRLCELTGYSREELTARTSQDITHPDDLALDLENLGRLLAGEVRAYSMEKRYARKDGSPVWVHLTVTLVRTSSGEPDYFISVIQDIDRQKQAEQRLRLALNVPTIGVLFFRLDGHILEANAAFERMSGYTAEGLRGLADWMARTAPEHREATARAAADLAGRGETAPYEKVMIRPDGSRWWGLFAPTRLAGTGRDSDCIEFIINITERKRRSEQIRKLAEVSTRLHASRDTATILAALADEVRELIGAHQAATSLAVDGDRGRVSNTVSLSDEYAAWRVDDTRPAVPGLNALVCRTNRPIRLTREQLEAHPAWSGPGERGGDRPPMRGWMAAPLIGRDGTNLGLIQVADRYEGEFTEEDEAVLVQLAQMASVAIENVRLYEALREDDRKKDEFLAMLAHELRNPLAAIHGAVRVARSPGMDAYRPQAMEIIERQGRNLARLIDDLLDVSRITQGKVELRREDIEIATVIDRAAQAVRPMMEEKRHRLSIGLVDGSLRVHADPTRLEQVLANLLTNAAKYTEPGGHIAVSAGREGGEAVIRVRDDGVGIPPEMLTRVFDLFTQVDHSLARSEGGLGIGLALVRRLVEMHGGTVSAASQVGAGSEFTVRLPLVEAADGPAEAGRSEMASGSGRRVLVVDDDADTASLTGRLLELSGFEVRVCFDGRQSLAVARDFRPEVVLLDIGLPGMSGYELAGRLRQEICCRDSLIIGVSGYGDEEARSRARQAGFDHFLVKPAEIDTIAGLAAGAR